MSNEYKAVSELSEKDFVECPVWAWAEEDDESIVKPIWEVDVLPTDSDALFVSARIKIANGRTFNGSVSVRCSDHAVYLIEVFLTRSSIDLPLLDKARFFRGLSEFAESVNLPPSEVLPLSFDTDFHFAGQSNICGEIPLRSDT